MTKKNLINCKKPGHLSRNCPQGNIVKSNGNKPPGLTNYNIEFEPEISDNVKVLDSLELRMVEFGNGPKIHMFSYEPAWSEYNPEAQQCERLGDSLALMAEYVLDIMQPYPGDDEFLHSGVRQRFEVFTCPHACFYQIYDCLTRKGCLIWTGYLKNPHFCLGEWYTCWQAHKYNLIEKPKRPWTIGDAYTYNAMCVLRNGIPTLYPSSDLKIDDEFRFTVVSKSEDRYFIHDEDFKEPLTMNKSFLLNPRINLGSWHRAKCFPKSVETPDDDLNIDFSIFDCVWYFLYLRIMPLLMKAKTYLYHTQEVALMTKYLVVNQVLIQIQNMKGHLYCGQLAKVTQRGKTMMTYLVCSQFQTLVRN